MRRLAALGLLLVAMLMSGPAAGAIVFGQLDGDAHPNVGAVVVEREGRQYAACSGTLIDDNVVLTAAHCVADGQRLSVSFDPTFDQDSQLLPGTADAHDLYGSRGADNPYDIAVILLDEPARGISPAELPTASLLDHLRAQHLLNRHTFTAVGYGTVRDDKTGGPHTLKGSPDDTDRRYALQGARSLQKSWLTLSMQPATGDGGTCYGDSGGPHFLGGADSDVIVSITVTGDRFCRATDKTYRLDTAWARDFLADFVALP